MRYIQNIQEENLNFICNRAKITSTIELFLLNVEENLKSILKIKIVFTFYVVISGDRIDDYLIRVN